MKIGLIFNPNSGKCRIKDEIMVALAGKLSGDHLYCTSSTYENLKNYFKLDVIEDEIACNCTDTIRAAEKLCNVDLIISFGGDGTVSDIITGLRTAKKLVPIAGVALGTANAGPFIKFRNPEDILNFNFHSIQTEMVPGLDVYCHGEYCGSAFNDVVISDTLVSTVNGETKTILANEFYYRNKRVMAEPSVISMEKSMVFLNSKKLDLKNSISQIILSRVSREEMNFYNYKAYNGLFCWLPYCKSNSVMIISGEPIIRMTDNVDNYAVNLEQVIFSERDTVKFVNFKGFCIIDGNPRVDMTKFPEVEIISNERAGLKVK
jgi:hypothetical protein